MIVDLTPQQIDILLAMINQVSFRGEVAEIIVDLKATLRQALDQQVTEHSEGT